MIWAGLGAGHDCSFITLVARTIAAVPFTPGHEMVGEVSVCYDCVCAVQSSLLGWEECSAHTMVS